MDSHVTDSHSGRPCTTSIDPWLWLSARIADLLTVSVDPALQGQGLLSLPSAPALASAAATKEVWLEPLGAVKLLLRPSWLTTVLCTKA